MPLTLSFYRGVLLDFKNIPTVTRVFTGIAEFGIFLETTEQNEHFRTTVGKFGMFFYRTAVG